MVYVVSWHVSHTTPAGQFLSSVSAALERARLVAGLQCVNASAKVAVFNLDAGRDAMCRLVDNAAAHFAAQLTSPVLTASVLAGGCETATLPSITALP